VALFTRTQACFISPLLNFSTSRSQNSVYNCPECDYTITEYANEAILFLKTGKIEDE